MPATGGTCRVWSSGSERRCDRTPLRSVEPTSAGMWFGREVNRYTDGTNISLANALDGCHAELMYIMYVDESGDTGLAGSPTSYFALSGLVVHESRWRDFINILIQFKRTMRSVYGLPIRGEIHAAEFISSRAFNLDKHIRLAILRNTIDEIAKINFISITNVIVDKNMKPAGYDVFGDAWRTLFQRFENTMHHGNLPGGYRQDSGIVITDATSGRKLSRIVRKMAVYNPIPNDPRFGGGSRNLPVTKIIEDPYGKNSAETLPIQIADVCAYFLHQRFRPNSYIRRKRAQNYLDRLGGALNVHASRYHGLGIVQL